MAERRCARCGRIGAVMGVNLCPDCLRVEAMNKQNEIERQRMQQEQKAREEQARRERERDEQERKYREEQSRREHEREEQDRKFREEQLRQDREDRQRQLEAENRMQEQRLQIERERMEAEQRRYEEEKREREWKEQQERWERERQEQAKAWAERCEYLDNLSDEDMRDYFEISSNSDEREYLKQRYRKNVSPEDYLELIKDEDKYVMKKRIRRYINSHSDKESIDYLLNVEPSWYAEIVEKEFLMDFVINKEPLLKDFFEGDWSKKKVEEIKGFDDIAAKSCGLLKEKYDGADNSQYRQVLLRIIVGYLRFLEMSSVEKQIFFREFISNQMKGVEYSPDGYESENGILYSLIEPLYINSLEPAEQEKYLKMMKQAEEEYRAEQEKKKQAEEKRKQEIVERKAERAAKQELFNQKWQENEKVVEECNAAGLIREKLSKEIGEISQIGRKYLSQLYWSIFIVGLYALIFTKVTAFVVIVPIVLFCVSIAMFVKKNTFIGILCIPLFFLSFASVAINNNNESPLTTRMLGLLVVNIPLIILGIFAIKRIIDVKRLNNQVRKKAIEHDEKLEKQNALAEKNSELIKEIEKIQKEIESIKRIDESEMDPEMEELLNLK